MGRFLKTKIEIVNLKMLDVTGVEHIAIAETIIDLNEVAVVRQQAPDDEHIIDDNLCVVYLKSGEFFNLLMPYKEVVEALGWQ